MFRLATFDQLHGTTTCRASRAHKPLLSRENPPYSHPNYSRMIKYESMVWCCNATLFNALPRNCSDCFESRYILAFHAPARAVAATHSIAAAQQCTVSDAPHNVLTATNIVANGTSCSLNCDLVMGSVTVTKTRARPAGNCAVDGPASIASDGVSCNSFGQHEAHVQ